MRHALEVLMKMQLLGASILAALMGSTALAADLPAPMSMPAMPAPAPAAYDWTGFYLGLHGGYAWGESDVELSEADDGEIGETSIDLEGWLAGVQGGFNYQMGNFVVGIEADASWSDIDGSSSEDGDIGGAVTYNSDLELEWLATVRLRAGFAIDKALIYGTGGVAFAQMNYDYDITDDTDTVLISGDIDENMTGWTIGGGVEYAATQNFTVKLEYLYTDLGDFDDSTTIAAGGPIPEGTYSVDGDVTFHTVKLGANYKF
jgi:outer membrane immunogenic protein